MLFAFIKVIAMCTNFITNNYFKTFLKTDCCTEFLLRKRLRKLNSTLHLGPPKKLQKKCDWNLSSKSPPLCVKMGFTWTFPRNQDATVKLKSELISIKF